LSKLLLYSQALCSIIPHKNEGRQPNLTSLACP